VTRKRARYVQTHTESVPLLPNTTLDKPTAGLIWCDAALRREKTCYAVIFQQYAPVPFAASWVAPHITQAVTFLLMFRSLWMPSKRYMT
jgi:hypothetical protein